MKYLIRSLLLAVGFPLWLLMVILDLMAWGLKMVLEILDELYDQWA